MFFPRCKLFLASALSICYTEMAERVFPVSCILFPVHAQMLFLCAGSSHNLPFHFRSAVFLLPVSLLLPHKFLKWRCILSPLCGKSARFGRLFASFLTILVLFPVLCYTSSQYAAYFSCDKAAPGIRIPLFLRRPWAVSFFVSAFFPGLPDGIIILSQRKCI